MGTTVLISSRFTVRTFVSVGLGSNVHCGTLDARHPANPVTCLLLRGIILETAWCGAYHSPVSTVPLHLTQQAHEFAGIKLQNQLAGAGNPKLLGKTRSFDHVLI